MPDQPPFSPSIMLLTLSHSWGSSVNEALRPLGLTTRKYGLLAHLRATPGLSFSELARRSRITVQSVHTTMATLVDAGLVDDDTAHAGSASSLRITRAGEALLARAADAVGAVDAELAAALPDLTDVLRAQMMRMLGGPT